MLKTPKGSIYWICMIFRMSEAIMLRITQRQPWRLLRSISRKLFKRKLRHRHRRKRILTKGPVKGPRGKSSGQLVPSGLPKVNCPRTGLRRHPQKRNAVTYPLGGKRSNFRSTPKISHKTFPLNPKHPVYLKLISCPHLLSHLFPHLFPQPRSGCSPPHPPTPPRPISPSKTQKPHQS